MPKLTDILKRASKIESGELQLFIADQDFEFCGFPIKENSLVYYDGKDEVKINMIEYALFGPLSVPLLSGNSLTENDDFEYETVCVGTCAKEDSFLKIAWRGIWHNNHFDKWKGSFDGHRERIAQLPPLQYQGILFSPLTYTFKPKSKVLDYFLSADLVDVVVNGHKITLPKDVEISITKDAAVVIPIGKEQVIHYFKIPLQGIMQINEDGSLIGQIGKEMEFTIHDNDKLNSIIVTYNNVEISRNGKAFIELREEKSGAIKKYRITPKI